MRNGLKISIFILLLCVISAPAFSQSKQVREALRKIASGKIMEAQGMLSELQEAGKDDPAIMYLQGVLTEDAYKAVGIYRKITTDFPQSEWADDAYWRLVQFYAVKGDTAKAVKELDIFKAKHPASEFLSPATDIVRSALTYHRSANNNKKKPTESAKAPEITPEKKEAIAKYNEKIKAEKSAKTEKAVKPEKVEKPDATDDKPEGKIKSWGLQVGVYSTIEAAKEETDKFRQQRLRNEIIEKEINGKKMFAVIIGNYASKESAEKNREIVEKICGCETMIYGKK